MSRRQTPESNQKFFFFNEKRHVYIFRKLSCFQCDYNTVTHFTNVLFNLTQFSVLKRMLQFTAVSSKNASHM